MEGLLDVESAAGLLAISAWTIRKYLSTNKLRSVRIGRRVLIEPSEIRRLIEEGRTAAVDQPHAAESTQ
jgi:excisionase family DNA binding protein